MRRVQQLVATLAVLLLAACGTADKRAADREGDPPQWRANQLIVALDIRGEPEVDVLVERLSRDYAIAPVKRFPLTSINVVCVVFVAPDDTALAALAARIEQEPDVRLAQVNQVFASQGAGGDRYAQLQWSAQALGVTVLDGQLTGAGVRVGIVDTAVDAQHPDLGGAVSSSKNFVADDVGAQSAEAHGTAVAGIVAARADNGHGIVGIAPAASLVVARACWYRRRDATAAHCSSWSLARAIDYLINERVDIVNLSLAGPDDALVSEVIAQAMRQDMAVVAASRRGETGPGFPASEAGVVAVIAADSQGSWPKEAWHSRLLPVPAPGIEILTTLPPSRYDYLSGSSMAAGHVSAMLALLHEAAPDATTDQRVAALRASAAGARQGRALHVCDALLHLLKVGFLCAEPWR